MFVLMSGDGGGSSIGVIGSSRVWLWWLECGGLEVAGGGRRCRCGRGYGGGRWRWRAGGSGGGALWRLCGAVWLSVGGCGWLSVGGGIDGLESDGGGYFNVCVCVVVVMWWWLLGSKSRAQTTN